MKVIVLIFLLTQVSLFLHAELPSAEYQADLTNLVAKIIVRNADKKSTPMGFGNAALGKAYQELKSQLKIDASGTGFLIKENNAYYLVTSAHVVDRAINCTVWAEFKGQEYPLRWEGGDTFFDIAIFSFPENPIPPRLQVLNFREQPLSVGSLGEPIRTIGFAEGSDYYFKSGEITGLNKMLNAPGSFYGMVRHSASLKPGCSGGPLLNRQNQVLGINIRRSIKDPTDNFSLEAYLALRVIRNILQHGDRRMHRAFIGTAFTSDGVNPPQIAACLPNTPAYDSLSAYHGYYLLKMNGVRVQNPLHIIKFLDSVEVGTKIKLTLSQDPDGSNQVYPSPEITTTSLDEVHLASIARNFLANHLCLDLKEPLDLRGNFDNSNSPFKVMEISGKSTSPVNSATMFAGQPDNSTINDSRYYAIRSLKDLGILIRVSAIYGPFKIYCAAEDNVQIGLKIKSFGEGVQKILYN